MTEPTTPERDEHGPLSRSRVRREAITAGREPLDLEAYRADIDRAHTEVGEICQRTGAGRWRMSIPARPDRDSDLLISTGLRRGERLADEVERLRAELAGARQIIEQMRDRHHARTERHGSGCISCGRLWPCPDHLEADAFLGTQEAGRG